VTSESLLPHLDAAYNLARWLMGNDADAEDVVQEACVNAIAAARTFRGGDVRAWLLTIVRNGCYSVFRRRRGREMTTVDEDVNPLVSPDASPESLALGRERAERVHAALANLPVEFREALVLREFEGLSYKEIADVMGVPIGTVMSRLSRGRTHLHTALTAGLREG
jgi:RNA polymerase sigma-70 factor (ECF subfamily)